MILTALDFRGDQTGYRLLQTRFLDVPSLYRYYLRCPL